MPTTIITGARLIDGTGSQPKDNATIEITDGRITAVKSGSKETGNSAPATQAIDVAGRTVLPGLINAHIHILMDAGPDPLASLARVTLPSATLAGLLEGRRMLDAGITTARDLGGYEWVELALRGAFERGDFPGPRLLCAGKLITMTGGHGWPLGFETDGPDEVRKAARQNLKRGVDCLKLMATGGVLTEGVEPGASQLGEEELRAGIEEAHKVGKRTASHAQGTDGIKAAIRAGIDTIEHGIIMDDEAIEMMLKRDVIFVPTLAAPFRIVEAGESKGIPVWALEKSKRVIDIHTRSFEMALEAGVTIAAGNDGGTPFNPSHDLVTEIELLAQGGMGALGAIRAATLGSARALGISEDTGTIQVGKRADLLVLESGADPLAGVEALGNVWAVIRNGKVVVGEHNLAGTERR